MTQRYRGDGGSFYDLVGGETLVTCPRCSQCALHRPLEGPADQPEECLPPRRLTCGSCHYVETWQGDRFEMDTRQGIDGYFQLPLWLATPCCGEVLWALGPEHLEFLESYVAAGLREAGESPVGYRNKVLTSRLPKWIKLAKNRDKVRRGLKKLRGRLTE